MEFNDAAGSDTVKPDIIEVRTSEDTLFARTICADSINARIRMFAALTAFQ